ncbi:restriction endonuclease subunit S [Neptuniibacter sp. 1_MG-2023]|uniref:restriction endonuclease subunit S n=1 Tax=Neptuniibacter sp. 1_MG-2023 TaxID=3062662 RepID=UPI0026E2F304|nr:restriction endonuclease subunit S [Neptuniibacter sp. 1_MG-2023]MDO6594433.1 restriction endonuclease subunit S [Neptuniibacter sp. 1_MG-2023]
MKAKYQAYPEYIDAGVEWLDVIPAHWSVPSLKMLIDVRDGTHDTPSYVSPSKSSFYLVTSKDVTSGQLSFEQCKHISKDDYLSIIQRSKVDVGDILMPMIGTVGSPIVVNERDDFAIKNLALFKTSINQDINTTFLNFFLQSSECDSQLSLEARGGVQNFVSLGTLRDLGFLRAPNDEQEKIANFLDHETAKIDTLIDKQQQLIKLLKEKRQAVISHAVTKGLNPNVPMKDSGVEWLGEVPEHWVLPKVAHLSKVSNGSTPDKNNKTYWLDGSIPWLASTCLNETEVLSSVEFITDKALVSTSVQLVPANSVLVGMVGQGKTRGSSSVLRFDSCINQNMAAITPNQNVHCDFLFFIFQAMYEDLRELGRGGNQAALNCEIIGALRIPTPQIEEQSEIVQYLKSKLKKIDKTNGFCVRQISLLKERRTALISAAVTGKIDVRNWQLEQPKSSMEATA